MQEGLGGGATARQLHDTARQLHDKAYFLDLLGDSHSGLGHHEAAIEAYRQAAQGFSEQGAQCSHALCLLKIAGSYLSLAEPWHAIGYLEACLPLLRDLGLVRHEALAQQQLAACQAALAEARLAGEGRAGPWSGRPGPARPARQTTSDATFALVSEPALATATQAPAARTRSSAHAGSRFVNNAHR